MVFLGKFKSHSNRQFHEDEYKENTSCDKSGNCMFIDSCNDQHCKQSTANSETTRFRNPSRYSATHYGRHSDSGHWYRNNQFFIRWLEQKDKPRLRFDNPTVSEYGYHTIRIHNDGDATALECSCKIELNISKDDIRKGVNGWEYASLNPQFFDSPEGKLEGKYLHWRSVSNDKTKISRKWYADLDILTVISNESKMSEFTPSKLESVPTYLAFPSSLEGYRVLLAALNPRKYEGRLILECDNHDTIEKQLTIDYDYATQKAILKLG